MLAAAVVQAVLAVAGAAVPFRDCFIVWNPAPPTLVSWDVAAAAILARG